MQDICWIQFLSVAGCEARKLRKNHPGVPILASDPDDKPNAFNDISDMQTTRFASVASSPAPSPPILLLTRRIPCPSFPLTPIDLLFASPIQFGLILMPRRCLQLRLLSGRLSLVWNLHEVVHLWHIQCILRPLLVVMVLVGRFPLTPWTPTRKVIVSRMNILQVLLRQQVLLFLFPFHNVAPPCC